MKEVARDWRKLLTLLLVIALLVQVSPLQAFADRQDETAVQETMSAVPEEEVPELTVVGEEESRREEDVKHFLNSDGSFTAVKYSEPVHYRRSEGSSWEDIDNTLRLSNVKSGEFTPASSPLDVSLTSSFGKDKTVSVRNAGYELSWSYLKPDAEITDPGAVETQALKPVEKTVQAKKLELKTDEADTALSMPDKLADGLVYADVFPNVDIEYILDSVNLKENLVLKKSGAQNEFVAQYNIGKLKAEQTEEHSIELRDEQGEVIFRIIAPYMFDANGQTSDGVALSILSDTDGVMRVKITADKAWLNDKSRAYPVRIDPNVLEAVQRFDQDATALYKSGASYPDGSLVIGNDKGAAYSKAKAYVKFSLPTLGAGDVVTSGMLCMSQYSGSYGFSGGDVNSLQINVYKVTSSWDGNSIKKTRGYTGLPSVSSTVVDYKNVSLSTSSDWVKFDVSKAVKQWYDGETNYGLCLRADDESTWALASFVAADNTNISYRKPQLVVTYRNNKGLESYWSAHEQNLGESGVGYINDYTGNLVYIAPLLSTSGNKMPVSLSLVYNGYQHGSAIDRPDTVGKGWRLNIQEKLTPITKSGGLQTKLYDMGYRYIYSDSDGTEHYFYYDEDKDRTIDEDGLGLTLTVNSTETDLEKYVITADAGGKMSFSSSGRLRKVYDDNGNYYKVLFNNDGSISSVVDGAGRKISITHDSSGRISSIKQPVSGSEYRTVTLNYSSWGGLSSISYPGSRTTRFYYTDSGAKLNTVDAINGNRLVYTYPTSGDEAAKSRVSKVTEYSSGSSREMGNSLSISYDGMNRTRFTDNQNRSETYQFDNWGRTVGLLDAAGNGSQYSFSSTTGKKNNTLQSAGVASKYVDNRLVNHSFENNLSSWSYETGKVGTDSGKAYLGGKSEKLNPEGLVSQKLDKVSGYNYYTSSVYAMGSSDSSRIRLSIYFYDANGGYMTSKWSEQDLSGDTWERKQLSFKLPDGTASFRVRYINCGTDNIWIDCAQLETGSAMSAYNMVQNGGFENTSSTVWETVNCTSSDKYYTGETYGRYFYMKGDGAADKRLIQKVEINRPASKLFLSVSGYAKGESVPLHWTENRQFSLSVAFHFTDGTESYRYIPFNPDYAAGWQYASGTVGVKDPGNKTVDYVYIRCCYYENENAARFDRIQVNIDECGTSYTYDSEGNLISAKDNAGRQESYNYNNASDLTKFTTADNKAYEFSYSDTYKHRLLSATSNSSKVNNRFEYDAHGNLTSTTVTHPDTDKYISQYSEYTADGNYLAKSNSDRGYATSYDYNSYKGTLGSVTDPNGNKTSYTYDGNTDRMKTVTAGNSTVSYAYNAKGQLSSITAPGATSYTFAYDAWGKNTAVKAGDRTLVTNSYAANNGLLEKQTYGNDFTVGHNYDSLDRETSRVYNNGNSDVAKYYWTYNADGNLARYTETSGRVLTYQYDDIGRLLQVSGDDGSYIKTSYDNVDKSTQLHYKFNGQRRDVYFGYSSRDNLPLTVKFGANSAYVVENNYDELTRLRFRTYTLGSSGTKINTSYSYLDWTSDTKRTTGTVRGIDYTFTSGELSTHDRWYTYDKAGNILSECIWTTDATKTVKESYAYDSKNQLTAHDSATLNKKFTYAYDAAGNILSKTEYNKENGTTKTVTYGYSDSSWHDLLTSYDGQAITYDSIGNPTAYRGWTMSWQGRQLASAAKNGTSLSFTYDSDGIRTSKTVGNVKTSYLLNGTQILAQTTNGKTLCFFYDQQGNRVAMADSSNHIYYYLYNFQGDVIALADGQTGKLAATYTYDAWGKCTVKNATGFTIGTENPFRYRGYYYDSETELYYLQSRYYDAETGRFINADKHIVTDYKNVLSANMFAYCENNPTANDDQSGEFINTILGAITGAVSAVVTRDRRESWTKAFWRGAATGAIAGLGVDICIATGGVGGLIAVAALGAVSGLADKYISKKNVGEKATAGELATSAVVGMGVNLAFGAYGRVERRATGKTAKDVCTAMWKNTKDLFLSNKGNFYKPKAIRNLGQGLAESIAGTAVTWYGNGKLGNG